MKIYFIRHGESEANRARVHAGWAQVSLTELGFAQARNAGERIKHIRFDKVYSSDLKRSIQTANTALPTAMPILDARLRELNVGELVGYSRAECAEKYGESYVKDRAARDYTAYGGENENMIRARAGEFVNDLLCQKLDTVCVFCHEGLIRAVLENTTGADGRCAYYPNCLIAVFEEREGSLVLHSWNI